MKVQNKWQMYITVSRLYNKSSLSVRRNNLVTGKKIIKCHILRRRVITHKIRKQDVIRSKITFPRKLNVF